MRKQNQNKNNNKPKIGSRNSIIIVHGNRPHVHVSWAAHCYLWSAREIEPASSTLHQYNRPAAAALLPPPLVACANSLVTLVVLVARLLRALHNCLMHASAIACNSHQGAGSTIQLAS